VTLTISDPYGRTASTTQSITIGAGATPTAAFVFSPLTPLPAQQVNFNASASRPAPGRTLVSYTWDFGDGTSGSGVQTSHSFTRSGAFNITLVVTDDAGRKASVTVSVNVGGDTPTASFIFSPERPFAGQTVNFNASASTAVAGRTIVSYSWSFGDGTTGSGVSPGKSYAVPGTYNVLLTVTDSEGKTGTVTRAVTVQ
jgi:chitinase